MKRVLKWLLIAPTAVLLTLVVAVNMLAVPDALPPDPAQLIELPDGSRRPLGELVEAWSRPAQEPVNAVDAGPADAAPTDDRTARQADVTDALDAATIARILEEARLERERWLAEGPPEGDLYDLAEWHRQIGHPEQAAALFASIPEGDRQYARAQRRLGWHCYADDMGQPARGVPHVHASLAADPLDGNAWQDAARVYAATLGLPVD